jgi:hypothetical protein
MTLQKQFNKIADKYIKAFSRKQDFVLDFWVADIIGDTAFFGDLCFTYDNIRLDVDNDIPKGEIIKWYDFALEQHYTENKEDFSLPTISYRSWLINEGLLKRNN